MSEREFFASRVGYEWGMERCDENLDIIDNDFSPEGELEWFKREKRHDFDGDTRLVSRLVLVRDVWNHAEMVTDREWAYLNEDGTLPEFFADAYGYQGSKVPQRLHQEFEKNKDWASQYTV
jgi:acyl carrier protein phosphodiesterase